MLEYILNKLYNDYMTVSLNDTIGSIPTNIGIVCQLWNRRVYKHLMDNPNQFNWNSFVEKHPINTFE